jgi:uncharacterized protein YggE
MNRRLFLGTCLLTAAAFFAAGCEEGDTIVSSTGESSQGISVTGTGTAFGAPDVATLTLGVQAEARTVAQARDDAARSLQGAIDSIKKNGVEDKDIHTVQFTVEPLYDTSGRVQTLRGYRVTNVVSVRIKKVDNAGKIIDDAVAAGGNNIVVRGISFSIEDPTQLEEAARADAVKEAKDRAEQLAKHSGVKLGRPLVISEGGGRVTPQFFSGDSFAAARTEAPTPVQPGELQVQVTVSLLYKIED